MNLITFAQLLLRRWWLILGLAAVGAVSAYYVQTHIPARYQSSINLQLNPAAKSAFLPYLSDPTSASSASPVVLLAASYREVLRGRTFGEVVVQQLKLKVSPDAVASAINTQLLPNTNILRLSVIWDTPADAVQLTQRVAEIFISENLRVQQSEPTTQARLSQLEQSARDIQLRRTPLEQQRDRLDQAVAHGDMSRLSELNQLEASLTGLETSYANVLVEMSRIRGSFDTAAILDRASGAQAIDTVPPAQALVFGLVGGLVLGVGVALLWDYLGDAVRSPRDVVAATGMPPLGRVRHAATWSWRKPMAQSNRALVMLGGERSLAAEAFRSLGAAVRLNARDRPLRVLVVTSPGSGEGKTFVASNLAITLAQSGSRVLLVDADLRRPVIHTVFGISNTVGLVDALRRMLGDASAVSQGQHETSHADPTRTPGLVASNIENLWLLPAGTPLRNPGELLSSNRLGQLLKDLAQEWDAVVLDSAPIGTVADTLLLGQHASACLLVARWGRTRRAALGGAIAALRGVGRPLVGVVLNDERPGPLARFSRDDYYRHGYWSRAPTSDAAEPAVAEQSTLELAGGYRPDQSTRRARLPPPDRPRMTEHEERTD